MDRELRLLALDDSQEFVSALLAELRSYGYLLVHLHTRTVEAMARALDEEAWDAVVADYSMPDFRAAGALELIRKRGLDIPVIVVSENLGGDVGLAALRAGAHDYLLKSQLGWIGLVVERALRQAGERKRRREAEEALRVAERRMAESRVDEPAGAPGGLVVLCDVRGNVTSCSGELLRLLGYEPEDVVGRNWIQYFLPPDERERVEEAFFLAVTRGSPGGFQDHDVVTLLGARCAVRWTNAALVDGDGRIVGVASVGVALGQERPAADRLPPSAPGGRRADHLLAVTH